MACGSCKKRQVVQKQNLNVIREAPQGAINRPAPVVKIGPARRRKKQ